MNTSDGSAPLGASSNFTLLQGQAQQQRRDASSGYSGKGMAMHLSLKGVCVASLLVLG